LLEFKQKQIYANELTLFL